MLIPGGRLVRLCSTCLCLGPLLVSSGCATKTISSEYYKSRQTADLEVPPALIAPKEDRGMAIPEVSGSGTATLSTFAGDCKAKPTLDVLPAQDDIKILRDGTHAWLLAKGSPSLLWPWVREFWLTKGFDIELESPRQGIMETGWLEYADIAEGPKKKDHYRARLEYGVQSGVTEIHLAQEGLIQSKDKQGGWIPRDIDRELEIEMLKRLAIYLGANKSQIDQAQAERQKQQGEVVRDTDGQVLLLLEGDRTTAWPRLKHALDRLMSQHELVPGSTDRYRIIKNKATKQTSSATGWIDSLVPTFKSSSTSYIMQLTSQENNVLVRLLDDAGHPRNDEAAFSILSEIANAL